MTLEIKNYSTTNAPVVALHASASSSCQWNKLIKDLQGRFSVYAFDLPGYGDAPLRSDNSQTGIAASALPVIQKIEELGERVHLVGHSNGGNVALKIAMMRPDLIKSLSLYEPISAQFMKTRDAISTKQYRQLQCLYGLLTCSTAMGDPASGMEHFLDTWNCAGFWNNLPANTQQKFSSMAPSVMADFAQMFTDTSELSELHALEIPTLIMCGLESPAIAQNIATLIVNSMPNARLALLPVLGHMAPITQPEWVNPRIFEHITGVERPAVNCSWPTRAAA